MIWIILILFILLSYQENFIDIKRNKNDSWYNGTCKYQVERTIRKILELNSVERSEKDWTLYLPCDLNKLKKEMSELKPNQNSKIFMITGQINIINKDLLWINFYKKFGEDAKKYLPNTFILYDPEDMKRFHNQYIYKQKYILKKNVQRQEGLKITDEKIDIVTDSDSVIVQELLTTPFLINQRKINIRIYLLIVCSQKQQDAYFHYDGFVYYAPKVFDEKSLDPDVHITTGYLEDRKLYKDNPLTLDDLRKFLGKNSKILFRNVKQLLKVLLKTVGPKLCKGFKDHISFQLFGVDFGVEKDLSVKLMEVNKGPNLSGMDARDKKLKENVVRDIFRLVKIIPGEDHQFIPFYSI